MSTTDGTPYDSIELAHPSVPRNDDIEAVAGNAQPPIASPPRRRDVFIPGFRNRPPFLSWLKHNYLDIMTQLLCVGVAFLMYMFVWPVMPHYFPFYEGIGRTEWGKKYGKPYRSEYITTLVSAIVSFAAPAAVMGFIALWITRDFADGNAAIIGLSYALATATLFQAFLKVFIGGLRPHFLSICDPQLTTRSRTSAIGSVDRLYYSPDEICYGDEMKVKEAQMSFPSGHACAAFAGFGFLALYLNAKFKVFGHGRRSGLPQPSKSDMTQYVDTNAEQSTSSSSHGRIQHWKLMLFALPWCIAVVMAGSKIRDG